jgi:hypothetical protein
VSGLFKSWIAGSNPTQVENLFTDLILLSPVEFQIIFLSLSPLIHSTKKHILNVNYLCEDKRPWSTLYFEWPYLQFNVISGYIILIASLRTAMAECF